MIISPSKFCAIDFFKIIIIVILLLSASNSLAEGNNTDINLKIGPLLKREISKEKSEQNLLESYGVGEQKNTEEAETIIKVIVVIDANYLKPLPEDILRALTEKVELLGGRVGNHAFNNVQVWIPIGKIEELASWTKIKLIKKPTLPEPNDIVTGGLNFIGAGEWHNAGVTGKGVKVGVIDSGFSGYSSLLGTELPAIVETAYTGNQSDFISTIHGTACAEIVHDVAPDAELFLINVADMEVDFPLAVKWLKSKGVDVISSSIGLNLKYYSTMIYWMLKGDSYTSYLANKVLENLEQTKAQMNYMVSIVVASGVTWSQAAGNDGQKKWNGWFTDNDHDGLLNFSSYEDYNKIDTRGIVNDNVYVLLMWDFDDSLTYDDYNLYIVDQYKNIVDKSTINQWEIPLGIEACKFTVQPGKEYYAFVKKYNAEDQPLVLLVGHSKFPSLKYHDAYGTVNLNCPAANPDVITVGAVHRADSPPYVTIADYSSQGPVDGMIKPDLVAPAGVRTASYSNYFYGTSAAAPHVAGICALVKQKYPALTPTQIKNYLASNAVDLGTPGKENVYGSGLVHLPEVPYADLVPYKPDGWSDKIVISSMQGNNTDNSVFTEEDVLYVDWALLNNSNMDIPVAFTTSLYIDEVLMKTWTSDSLLAGYYANVKDYSIGKLTSGIHSIMINADTGNSVRESDESNNSYVKNITVSAVSPLPPASDFTSNIKSGVGQLSVQFTDSSTGEITSWSWNFGDGTTSTDQNPIHVYQQPGTYNVSLTVTGPGGSTTESKTAYITVTEPIQGNCTIDILDGQFPLNAEYSWNYSQIVLPIKETNPADCKPFAVGDLSSGNLSLQVALPAFSQGVDVYLAIGFSNALFLIDGSNVLHSLTEVTVLPKWKTNNSAAIDESLYGDIQISLLPSGVYNLYTLVVPSGETDFSNYYFWSTSFIVNN
ncbi:MAG: S8 family serine peptidase [Pseudomonadota bacterium]|nr:S8 family serine peptidase [Pseudomonadota bacterium]